MLLPLSHVICVGLVVARLNQSAEKRLTLSEDHIMWKVILLSPFWMSGMQIADPHELVKAHLPEV